MMIQLIPLLFSLLSALGQPQEANIVFAGDAMQHQKQIDTSRRADGTYDYTHMFDSLRDYISEADYAVVNLETPVAGGRYSGYPMFNAPDPFVDALIDAGFDMLLTANNHVLDRFDDGVRKTVKALDSKKIAHIGSYTDAAERDRRIPCVKDINSFKVGFLNYTYGTNGITVKSDVIVDYIDRRRIIEDIKATRNAGAEILVVCMHWGVEYVLLPNTAQKELADFLIEQGVDMIIGGHPHVIQPMEIRDNPVTGGKSLVVYSLGNFISNMLKTDTRGGAMINAKLIRDDNGKARFDSASYRLVFVNQPSATSPHYSLVPIDADTDISKASPNLVAQCKAFVNNALRIFNKHNINVARYNK